MPTSLAEGRIPISRAGAGASRSGPAWPKATRPERAAYAVLAALLAGAAAIGVAMEPSPAGTGTHTHLGLPPCGFLAATGRPCPTCGVTTAYVLAAHGRLRDALMTQPFGLVILLCVAGGILTSAAAAVTGRSALPLVTPRRLAAALAVLAATALASWVYKWVTM